MIRMKLDANNFFKLKKTVRYAAKKKGIDKVYMLCEIDWFLQSFFVYNVLPIERVNAQENYLVY